MKFKNIAFCGIFFLFLSETCVGQKPSTIESTNKRLVKRAFDKWRSGTGNFFDLLADNVHWTVAGSSPVSGIYKSREQFLEKAVKPITNKLDGKITPVKLVGLYADKDVVLMLWEGEAKAKDGLPYNNTYCWQMTLKAGKIISAIAYLDTYILQELMTRVKD
jgi:ketosteroid isomerase-like protein